MYLYTIYGSACFKINNNAKITVNYDSEQSEFVLLSDILTEKSDTKVHCWMGWLYVGSVRTRLRLKVNPG